MIPIHLKSHIEERRSEHEELVITENITLDGVIDASEGWFGLTRYTANG